MSHQPENGNLRRQRRRYAPMNVQRQMEETEAEIRRGALWWRTNPVAPAIRMALVERGFDIDSGILINLCDREPGLEECAFGTFVSSAERFIKFDIELSPDGQQLIAIHECQDFTDSLDICGSKPGVGATNSFLAIEVLRELNRLAD